MANLNYFIQERVKLNGKERGTSFNVALPSASNHDERVFSIASGSFSDVVDFSNTLRCFSLKDGSELWNVKTENVLIRSQKKLSIILKYQNRYLYK